MGWLKSRQNSIWFFFFAIHTDQEDTFECLWKMIYTPAQLHPKFGVPGPGILFCGNNLSLPFQLPPAGIQLQAEKCLRHPHILPFLSSACNLRQVSPFLLLPDLFPHLLVYRLAAYFNCLLIYSPVYLFTCLFTCLLTYLLTSWCINLLPCWLAFASEKNQ